MATGTGTVEGEGEESMGRGRLATVALLLLAGSASAHDWYTGKMDPKTHGTCCGGKDCHPIDASTVEPDGHGGFVYLPDNWSIPRERVQESEDDNYHICDTAVQQFNWSPDHTGTHTSWHRFWTCFFAPRQVSELHR